MCNVKVNSWLNGRDAGYSEDSGQVVLSLAFLTGVDGMRTQWVIGPGVQPHLDFACSSAGRQEIVPGSQVQFAATVDYNFKGCTKEQNREHRYEVD